MAATSCRTQPPNFDEYTAVTEGRSTQRRGQSPSTAGPISYRPATTNFAVAASRSKETLSTRPNAAFFSQRAAVDQPPQQASEIVVQGEPVQNALRLAVFGHRSHVTGGPHVDMVKANRKELHLKEIHKTFARRLIDFTKSRVRVTSPDLHRAPTAASQRDGLL